MKSLSKVIGSLGVAILIGLAAAPATAQPGPGGPGYGMGPGMMGDYGGPGYGPGYGRGARGGGYGPGMMGGYGGGYGMGPGMMGGYGGGYGMGPGMMGGWWGGDSELNLTADQKTKVRQIQRDVGKKMWSLMGNMMEARNTLQDLYDADKQDSAAINKQYKVLEDERRQMVDISTDAHNRINEILTPEQKEKSRQWGGRGGYGPMMRGRGY